VGDRILIQVARRLSSIFRDTDTVARFGGDEFVAVIPNVSDVGEIIALADRVLKLFETSFEADDEEVYLSASLGISLYPDNGHDPTTLIKNADMAMYKAKEEGKNNFAFFNEEMNRRAVEVLQMKSKLHRAIEKKELAIYYQPVYRIEGGELLGFEALLRWESPDLGTVLPDKFIGLLEELGLIREVGEWVLRETFTKAKEWGDRFKVFVSVNISPRQFTDRRFLEKVGGMIKETGVNPAYVTLEITETSLMYNPEESATILKKLKVQGFNIALDDFGTGYSSLAYLRRLPIDVIKIDTSFTQSIVESDVDRAIVSSVVSLSTSLGLHTLAEGVERRDQMDVLRALGCDSAQGYFLGKPMTLEEAELLLGKEKRL
jgi:predicted signal transduction protein with EAL and GGDEF domain